MSLPDAPNGPVEAPQDGTCYLIKRVPKAFEVLDQRRMVRISTGIAFADDPRTIRAGDVVRQLNAKLEAYWRRL